MPDWEEDLCGRCLCILDSRTTVRAWGRKEDAPEVFLGSPISMRSLRSWVAEKLWGEGMMISVDDRPDAFRPVASWHGDAVCEAHLREAVVRDRR